MEIGALGRTPDEPDAPYSDGVVTGYGRIDGRPVVVYAHDKTVYGGSVGVTFGRKVCEVMDMAIKIGCPVIGIQDSGGARIQDAVTSLAMYSEIARRQLPLSGRSPQISIMMGKSAGGAVYAPVTTDFVVAVDGEAEMYITGPAVIKEVTGEVITSADLGGARQQELNGNISYVAHDEEDAFNYVHDLLARLPLTCHDPGPVYECQPDSEVAYTPELDSFMPDDTNAGYDMHELLAQLFDDADVQEVQPGFAPNIITAFAQVDGRSVGVVANQPIESAGCIDADAADKAARFIRICDAYNIPLIFVVDTPRLPARGAAGKGGPDPPRRQAGVRPGGGHGAEDFPDCAQSLWWGLRGHGVEKPVWRHQPGLAHRPNRGDGVRGRGGDDPG